MENTFFNPGTPKRVQTVINYLMHKDVRVRIWYGKNGESWDEENDICGYIGRSTGTKKIPLLINNKRSWGGGSLLDDCIVKIVRIDNHSVLYQHENFKQGNFTAKDNKVFKNNEPYAPNCKDNKSAQRLADFMNGARFSK